jgi:hypothetical protein
MSVFVPTTASKHRGIKSLASACRQCRERELVGSIPTRAAVSSLFLPASEFKGCSGGRLMPKFCEGQTSREKYMHESGKVIRNGPLGACTLPHSRQLGVA